MASTSRKASLDPGPGASLAWFAKALGLGEAPPRHGADRIVVRLVDVMPRAAISRPSFVFLVDLAESSGALERLDAVVGAAAVLLADRRARVAVIALRGAGRTCIVPATASQHRVRRSLAELRPYGRPSLSEGLAAAARAAASEAGRPDRRSPLLVVLSDGLGVATGTDALATARRFSVLRIPTLVVDTEPGPLDPGVLADVAGAMAARYVRVPGVDDDALAALARGATAAAGDDRLRPA